MRPIVCVLRTGGWSYRTQDNKRRHVEYDPNHVRRLQAQAQEFAPDSEFLCLTNTQVRNVRTIPLRHDWPGWWSKMELFRLDFPLLYLDLDVTITGSLQTMLEAPHVFTACSPLSKGKVADLNSSVMAWDHTPTFLYDAFLTRPEHYMERFRGDQDFIADGIDRWQTWDDRFPGAVVSYKKMKGKTRPETRIVVFNGRPKPEEVGM